MVSLFSRLSVVSCAVAIGLFASGPVVAQDADTREVQAYALTDAGLAKYTRATESLVALPGAACDDGQQAQSIRAMAARLDSIPGARAAIQAAGMTTREYVVFSWSLLQTGLAAWAVSQPGGKLPAGVSQSNVDFYKKHEAQLKRLERLKADDECEDEED